MTIYAQANEHGYVVSTSDKELLAGLWGGRGVIISPAAEAEIKRRRDKGIPVHVDEINGIEELVHAFGN
ncbi:hypothetical protein FJZ19_06120 [Candidatus Pacearchaeota archaeon]|nr:hypothetical protein [Candidatus Pacearchaeota archaeon]